MATGYEATLAATGRRRALGAWYTPADVVDGVLSLTLDPVLARAEAGGVDAVLALRVLDPACGTGNFLVAALDRISGALERLGVPATDARRGATSCVAGVDIDPEAVARGRDALAARAGCVGAADRSQLDGRVVTADALAESGSWWTGLSADGTFDAVVGNPPFLGQLRQATARSRSSAAALRSRFGDAAGGYTDPAALFLLLATELAAADGGVVGLIVPCPVLATRDASPVRDALLERARLRAVWVAGEPVFDASVAVCVPVLERTASGAGADPAPVAVLAGRGFTPLSLERAPMPGATWSALLATAAGLPRRDLETDGVLADIATATADFRDQYYGLAGHVVDGDLEAPDDGSRPRLVTAGLIDPAHLAWGRRRTRFAKVSYDRPRVVLAELDDALQAWARLRLVPKVLLATQTKVLEAVVDEDGSLLPSVPVITVVPRVGSGDRLFHLGALLCSPPATVLAARRHLGAGRNASALKLRAAEVLRLPLPTHAAEWDEGAAWFRKAGEASAAGALEAHRSHLEDSARAMCRAYGLGDDDALMAWWSARLPR